VLVVYGAVFLLYGLLAMYGQWVAQGIVEEKQSRVVEVLLAAVRPTELLGGKVLGLGVLGLAQILLFAGLAAGGLTLTEVIDMPAASWRSIALVIPWYVLGYLLYALIFAAAGSLVARVEELQSAVMPAILVLIGALFAAQFALAAPDSTVASVAGIVPFTAPIVQPILLAVGQATWWEVLLAIAIALATIALLLPLTARLYRGGILRTGSRVSFAEAWSSARERERAAAGS
jgi:ABC-2 type transport system permease protein